MNITLVFLLLISLFFLIWHIDMIKKEKQLHSALVNNLEQEIALQYDKKNKIVSKQQIDNFKMVAFKLSILQQQVDLLNAISDKNE